MVGPRPHRLSSVWRTSHLGIVLYMGRGVNAARRISRWRCLYSILYFHLPPNFYFNSHIMSLYSEFICIVLYRSLPFPWRNTSSTVYLLSCVLYLYCTLPTLIFFFAHCFKILSLPGSFTSFLSKVCIVLGLVDGKFLCCRSVFFLNFFTLAVGRLVRWFILAPYLTHSRFSLVKGHLSHSLDRMQTDLRMLDKLLGIWADCFPSITYRARRVFIKFARVPTELSVLPWLPRLCSCNSPAEALNTAATGLTEQIPQACNTNERLIWFV